MDPHYYTGSDDRDIRSSGQVDPATLAIRFWLGFERARAMGSAQAYVDGFRWSGILKPDVIEADRRLAEETQ